MRTMLGFLLLFAAATAVFYALHCLYVIFGYRQGNVATVTAKLTNHSIRRRWYDRQRWFDVKWTGYIYSYTVGGKEYQIKEEVFRKNDFHLHIPEGAVPKDGPSAGITMATAMLSAITGKKVRADVAMTGEISLRGRVMQIGGLKEKTMAALRHGISTVIIPEDNIRDLEEIDQTVRRQLNFITASSVDTVLDAALKRNSEIVPTMMDIPAEIMHRSRNNISQ